MNRWPCVIKLCQTLNNKHASEQKTGVQMDTAIPPTVSLVLQLSSSYNVNFAKWHFEPEFKKSLVAELNNKEIDTATDPPINPTIERVAGTSAFGCGSAAWIKTQTQSNNSMNDHGRRNKCDWNVRHATLQYRVIYLILQVTTSLVLKNEKKPRQLQGK